MKVINFLSSVTLTSLLLAQSSKPTVAILDFEGQGVSESEVQTLMRHARELSNSFSLALALASAKRAINQCHTRILPFLIPAFRFLGPSCILITSSAAAFQSVHQFTH